MLSRLAGCTSLSNEFIHFVDTLVGTVEDHDFSSCSVGRVSV